MVEVTIKHVGQQLGGIDGLRYHDAKFQNVAIFRAELGGDAVATSAVVLTPDAQLMALFVLDRDPALGADPHRALGTAIVRYAVQRMELLLADAFSAGAPVSKIVDTWELTADDVQTLVKLVGEKTCGYQRRFERDLFCRASAPTDPTATVEIDSRLSAPTSRPACRACSIPSGDILCAHLLHPQVTSMTTDNGTVSRKVIGVMCDQGREEISDVSRCHAAGHRCWQRRLDLGRRTIEAMSPMSLPEAFDMLDALWRLAFGSKKRILKLSVATAPAALTLSCANRVEFESRLSALSDIIGKLTIDPTLYPAVVEPDKLLGSLDAMTRCLVNRLEPRQHAPVTAAIHTLHRVNQARNAIQHGITNGGGLTAKLRELGIHDAPPNWAAAWDSIRAQTTDALTIIRDELRRYADTNA